jgi:hypothetical protein
MSYDFASYHVRLWICSDRSRRFETVSTRQRCIDRKLVMGDDFFRVLSCKSVKYVLILMRVDDLEQSQRATDGSNGNE